MKITLKELKQVIKEEARLCEATRDAQNAVDDMYDLKPGQVYKGAVESPEDGMLYSVEVTTERDEEEDQTFYIVKLYDNEGEVANESEGYSPDDVLYFLEEIGDWEFEYTL